MDVMLRFFRTILNSDHRFEQTEITRDVLGDYQFIDADPLVLDALKETFVSEQVHVTETAQTPDNKKHYIQIDKLQAIKFRIKKDCGFDDHALHIRIRGDDYEFFALERSTLETVYKYFGINIVTSPIYRSRNKTDNYFAFRQTSDALNNWEYAYIDTPASDTPNPSHNPEEASIENPVSNDIVETPEENNTTDSQGVDTPPINAVPEERNEKPVEHTPPASQEIQRTDPEIHDKNTHKTENNDFDQNNQSMTKSIPQSMSQDSQNANDTKPARLIACHLDRSGKLLNALQFKLATTAMNMNPGEEITLINIPLKSTGNVIKDHEIFMAQFEKTGLLTKNMRANIVKHILTLDKEIHSKLPYMNRGRKRVKLAALEAMLNCDDQVIVGNSNQSLADAVKTSFHGKHEKIITDGFISGMSFTFLGKTAKKGFHFGSRTQKIVETLDAQVKLTK